MIGRAQVRAIHVALLAALIVPCSGFLAAQDSDAHVARAEALLFGAGMGAGNLGIPAGSLVASYVNGHGLFAGRAAIDGKVFGDDLWDIALLYGYAINTREWLLAAAIGPAIVGGERSHGIFESGETIALRGGLAFESRIFWFPLRWLGLGTYGFADLNSERHFVGITLGGHVRIGL